MGAYGGLTGRQRRAGGREADGRTSTQADESGRGGNRAD